MLTSQNNQYLRPEYLTPLPTTLDAKKSPLALLAQTCSQIGADSPNSKLLQSTEKSSKKSSDSKEKSTDSSSIPKPIFKSYESVTNREKSRSPEERSNSSSSSRVRTPVTNSKNNSTHQQHDRCGSNQSATSPRSSPPVAVPERKTPATEPVERTSPSAKSERGSPQTPSSAQPKTAFTPNILTSSSDPAIKDLPLGTFKPGVPVTSAAFLNGYPPTVFPLPMDLMANSLMSQHHLKSAGGLSPYLNYGRLKATDTLSTVCRDPYCTGCSVSSHLLSNSLVKSSTCPAGCSQCDHMKIPTSTAAGGYLGHSSIAAAAYAHAQLAALSAASQLPFLCSWSSPDQAYCGKRFSTSEELFAHLRTHTGVSMTETNLNMLSASSNLPPTHPLLHRTYPTPPLSPLATARYHPYNKPSLLPPSISSSLSGFPGLNHPGLTPYISPFSLYGSRLGAAPGMHP